MSAQTSRIRFLGWGVIALGCAGFVAVNVAVAEARATAGDPPVEEIQYRTLDRMISTFAAEARAAKKP